MRDLYLPALQLQGDNPLPPVRGVHPAPEGFLSSSTVMSSAIGRAAVAPILAAPTVRSEQVSQLVLGETVSVLERSSDWRRVCTHVDGYHGWIHTGYLHEADDAAVEDWRARASGWSEGALLQLGEMSFALPLRARVKLEGASALLPGGRQGRISSGSVRTLNEVEPRHPA